MLEQLKDSKQTKLVIYTKLIKAFLGGGAGRRSKLGQFLEAKLFYNSFFLLELCASSSYIGIHS